MLCCAISHEKAAGRSRLPFNPVNSCPIYRSGKAGPFGLAFNRNDLDKLLNKQGKSSSLSEADAPASTPLVNVTKT
jgi:hypothetical protein